MDTAPSQTTLPLADSDHPTHPTQAANGGNDQPTRRTTIGHSTIEYRQASSILSKATGFIDAFDYTLNPYSGCTFVFVNRKGSHLIIEKGAIVHMQIHCLLIETGATGSESGRQRCGHRPSLPQTSD